MIIKYKLKDKKIIVIIFLDGVEYLFYFFNNLVFEFSGECHVTIVLIPGPIQGPGFGFWLDHLVTRVNLKKNQNDIVLVKKNQKSTGLQPGLAGSHRVFPSLIFSSTRSDSSL
jgi:hypothetical protein